MAIDRAGISSEMLAPTPDYLEGMLQVYSKQYEESNVSEMDIEEIERRARIYQYVIGQLLSSDDKQNVRKLDLRKEEANKLEVAQYGMTLARWLQGAGAATHIFSAAFGATGGAIVSNQLGAYIPGFMGPRAENAANAINGLLRNLYERNGLISYEQRAREVFDPIFNMRTAMKPLTQFAQGVDGAATVYNSFSDEYYKNKARYDGDSVKGKKDQASQEAGSLKQKTDADLQKLEQIARQRLDLISTIAR